MCISRKDKKKSKNSNKSLARLFQSKHEKNSNPIIYEWHPSPSNRKYQISQNTQKILPRNPKRNKNLNSRKKYTKTEMNEANIRKKAFFRFFFSPLLFRGHITALSKPLYVWDALHWMYMLENKLKRFEIFIS